MVDLRAELFINAIVWEETQFRLRLNPLFFHFYVDAGHIAVVCLFTSFQGEHTYTKYTLQFKVGM